MRILCVSVLLCGSAVGGVIHQDPLSNYLIVEAENFDSIQQGIPQLGFRRVDKNDDYLYTGYGSRVLPEDTNASGGAALYDQPGRGPGLATWKLQFANPGIYMLYIHYSMFDQRNDNTYSGEDTYGHEDSISLPIGFNKAPQIGTSRPPGNGVFALPKLGHDDPRESPPFWEGQFHWAQAKCQVGSRAKYRVDEDQVGDVLDYQIAEREAGVAIDAFVFSQDRYLTDDELTRMLTGFQPGDSDMDYDFDQLDLLEVLLANKYGKSATWEEGDWNKDGVFNHFDIVAALQTGNYMNGAYAAIPEPSSIILLAFGIALASAIRGRRVGD